MKYIFFTIIFFLCFNKTHAISNILNNESFESYNVVAENWDDFQSWNEIPASGAVKRSSVSYTGNSSVKLTCGSGNYPWIITRYELKGKTTFYLEWFGKTDGIGGNLELAIYYTVFNNTNTYYLLLDTLNNQKWKLSNLTYINPQTKINFSNTSWTKRYIKFFTPDIEFSSVTFAFRCSGSNGSYALLDQVKLIKSNFLISINNTNWPENSNTISIQPLEDLSNYELNIYISDLENSINLYTIDNLAIGQNSISFSLPIEDNIYLLKSKLCLKKECVEEELKYLLVQTPTFPEELLYISFFSPDFQNISTSTLLTLSESPYTGFAHFLGSAYDVKPKYIEDFQTQINLINNELNVKYKSVWPWVFLNRISSYNPTNCHPGIKAGVPNQEHFSKIIGLDIYDKQGALSDLLNTLKIALKISSMTNSPGIIFDQELYNDYSAYNLSYLAAVMKESETEIKSKLEEVGSRIADIFNEILPEGILWLLFYYNGIRTTDIIINGTLDRCKQMNYKFKIVEGGSVNIGYLHPNTNYLLNSVYNQRINLFSKLNLYNNFYLGGTIAPYIDIRLSSGFIKEDYNQRKTEYEIITIDDFEPLLKILFYSRKYNWLYGAGAAPYSEYNNSQALKYRPTIRKIVYYLTNRLLLPFHEIPKQVYLSKDSSYELIKIKQQKFICKIE